MGIYRKVLIEPFIKIKKQYEKYTATENACINNHIYYHNEKYCNKCGEEIKEMQVEKEQLIWPMELIGNENFWHETDDNYMYLFSNCYNIGFSDPAENQMKILFDEEIKSCIDVFKEKHKIDIKLIEKKLNIKVDVEFGIMYHAS